MRKNILAISGSPRTGSINHAILELIAEKYRDRAEVRLFQGISGLPHFNPDLDKYEPPAAVKSFRQEIEASDAVIICTPEYVFSLPGSLKNALEWTVSTTLFLEKPTALIVASGLGEKAFESLQLIMRTLGAAVPTGASLLISGARAKLSDFQTLNDISHLMQALLESSEPRRH